jgi:ferrochelatase
MKSCLPAVESLKSLENSKKIGVLLVNLGTPDAPTPSAVRAYLSEFLSDYRVTEMPRFLWKVILHGIILRTRPRHSSRKYDKIWTDSGSPLLTISHAQVRALKNALPENIEIFLGMRYGNPSIAEGIEKLCQARVQKILIFPLYPQYSSSTTGSTFESVTDVLKHWRWIPDITFISSYYDNPAYIHALVVHIKNYWAKHGTPDRLLFSFHGIPKRFFNAGDPYPLHCHRTSHLVAESLNLKESQWQTVFQSRFGREEWIEPYTDNTVITLGKSGIDRVDVICAGFAADCLETLEEIDQENRQLFLQSGGKVFHYIPALNDTPEHIKALSELINLYS